MESCRAVQWLFVPVQAGGEIVQIIVDLCFWILYTLPVDLPY